MTLRSITVFFSTLNLLLCICGYEFISATLGLSIDEGANRSITIPYHAFAAAVGIITILLNLKERVSLCGVQKWYLFFMVLMFVRFVIDVHWIGYIGPGLMTQYYLYMLFKGFLHFYAVLKSVRNISFESLLWWVYAFFSLSCVFTIAFNTSYQQTDVGRLNASSTLGSISAGHMGLSTILLSIYLLLYRKNKLWRKILIIGVTIVGFIIMLRSASRGPIATLAIVSVFWILSYSKNKARSIMILLCSVGLILILWNVILELLQQVSPALYDRFMWGEGEEGGQMSGRDGLIEKALQLFYESPLIGKRFLLDSGYGAAIYSHNYFIDALMQWGLVGGVLFLYTFGKGFAKGYKIISSKNPNLWLVLLFTQKFGLGMFSSSLALEPITSILLLLLLSSAFTDNNQHNFEQRYIRM